MKRKYSLLVLAAALMSIFLSSCNVKAVEENSWSKIQNSAKNTSVNLYVLQSDTKMEKFFSQKLKPKLLETEGITLNVSKISFEELYEKLSEELKVNEKTGKIDLVYLNKADLEKLKSAKLLYENFAPEIENVVRFQCFDSNDMNYIDSLALAGNAVAIDVNALSICYNDDIIYDPPLNLEELRNILAKKPGIFTYPSVDSELGAYFVRTVILNFTPSRKFLTNELTYDELKELVSPAMNYLKSLKANLYDSGNSYPASEHELNTLFNDKKIAFSMTMDFKSIDRNVGDAKYPENTRAIPFGNVTTGDITYFTIPFNSTNKAGAMSVINQMLSTDVQVMKLLDKESYGIPPYCTTKLKDEDINAIKKAFRKKTIPSIVDLIRVREHDIPTKYHKMINDIWKSEVLGN